MNYFFNYYRSKSIYTLMTLPLSEKWLYASKIATGILYFLIFLCGQLISIGVGYVLFKTPINYDMVVDVVDKHTLEISGMPLYAHKELYLTVVRNQLLRCILPLRGALLLLNLMIISSITMTTYHLFICLTSQKWLRWIPITLINCMMILMLINYSESEAEAGKIAVYILLLCIGALASILDSLRLMKKRSNL